MVLLTAVVAAAAAASASPSVEMTVTFFLLFITFWWKPAHQEEGYVLGCLLNNNSHVTLKDIYLVFWMWPRQTLFTSCCHLFLLLFDSGNNMIWWLVLIEEKSRKTRLLELLLHFGMRLRNYKAGNNVCYTKLLRA